jgi:hypothetical protein
VGGWELEVIEVESSENGVFNGTCWWTIPMFKNSGTKSRMINVMINEDYQMMNGRIKTIYNPDSPFVYDGRKDRTETAETTTTTTTSTATTTANTPTEITIENTIDSVYINDDGKIVVLDTAGNATTHEIPKDENGEDRSVTITDGAGNSYTVEGGEVKGGGEQPGTQISDTHVTDTTEVEIPPIEGINRNADLVVINTITSLFNPEEGRLEFTYTIRDTLNLVNTRLEIYKLDGDNEELVTFYTDLPKGESVEFADSQDDDKKGWSGKGSDGEFVEAGEYKIKLTATSDETFSNGYEDFEQFEVENTESTSEEIYDYFVIDDDAWYREKEAPYNTITPEPTTNILARGTQIAVLEIVKDSRDKEVAKMKLKGTGEIEYTSLSNLTQVKNFSEDRQYKFIKDYNSLRIPFSGNSANKTYKKDAEITADKYLGDYVKVKGEGGPVEGYWIAKSSLIWTDLIEIGNFLNETENATKVGTKYTGNETSVACNVCVRSALLILREDPALFSKEGSAFYDPANAFKVSYPKGYITNPGQAKNIKEDFDVVTTKVDLNGRFTEIIKKNDEDWEAYFKRLQDQADAGGIVIGAYISSDGSSGHVMMITPGGLVDINKNVPKWGESFSREDRGINKVPRVLECGSNSRDNEAPLCKNVDYNGAINRLKWFQYK